ncbi:MAG TPA: ribonuclease H [Caulobacteraceae bacterium]
MSSPVRIWLEISHHAVFRVGGWAWVRADGVSVSGHAGGDRRIDLERAALAGLVAALGQAPGRRAVQLHTASDLLAAIPDRIKAAQAGEDPPSDNLDLWAKATTLLASAPVAIVRAPRTPGAPAAFAAAWAEFARDKAGGKGAFISPIPKANLAKAGIAHFSP